eukprot:Partr_v1_DN26053_c1_g1_i1_m466 putative functions as component of the Arp2 3 complex which is involved in regulation of actin polymerization and together with an activating nucleation-promoting factor (NPF) mediates the formation of branched actin networks (By similarity)
MSGFRKIDIDAFDEDIYLEDEEMAAAAPPTDEEGNTTAPLQANITNVDYKPPTQQSSADLESQVAQRVKESRGLMNKSDLNGALKAILTDAPAGISVSNSVKETTTKCLMEVLSAAKATEIGEMVKKLTAAQVDLLMKYLYRGMASPELYNSASLLQWHEKVFEVGGYGSIARVLADRKPI